MSAFPLDAGTPLSAAPRVIRTRLRLTRRGRVVVATLASLPLVIALLALALNGGGATANSATAAFSNTAFSNTANATITVEAGQSLWAVASLVAPESSTADVVADLMAINGLDSASVQPGQQLIVPERYVD